MSACALCGGAPVPGETCQRCEKVGQALPRGDFQVSAPCECEALRAEVERLRARVCELEARNG